MTDSVRPVAVSSAIPTRLQRDLWAMVGVGALVLITVGVVARTSLAAAIAVAAVLVSVVILWFLRHATDGVALLSVLLVLIFVLPAGYSVVGLRSVGAPSFVFASGLCCWWLYQRLWRGHAERRRHRPMHVFLACFVVAWMVSYAMANRFAVSAQELRSMDRTLLVVAGWSGILLTAADSTPSVERLNQLGRRIVYFAGYVAFVAIFQSRQIFDFAQFDVPGLVAGGGRSSTYDVRSGFERIKSTTLHPIELGAVLGAVFPLAIHYLTQAGTRRERRIMGTCVGLLVVALPMTVTRTGVVTLAIGLAVLVPVWPRSWQKRFILWAIPSLLVLRVALPGLLGTLRSLFTSASDDPSVAGRQEDFPVVFDLIGRHPLVGIGPGRFTPEQYFFLDNQFLGTTIELGAVGSAALIALFLSGPVFATRAGQVAGGMAAKHFARALSAGLLAGFSTFFTFDTLSFPVISSLLFLYLGMIAAFYRLAHATSPGEQPQAFASLETTRRT